MTFAFYCTCGATWKGSADPKTAAQLKEEWKRQHTGPGHADTDAKTAARARDQFEKKYLACAAELTRVTGVSQ